MVQLIFDIYWKLVNFWIDFWILSVWITRPECLKGAMNEVKVRARTPGPGVYDKYVWSILREGGTPVISPGELNGLEVYVNL